MQKLPDIIRDVVAELDADGNGFRTREAADLLYHRARNGAAIPDAIAQLARRGAQVAIGEYKPERAAAQRATMFAGQRDMAEIADGFDRWISDFAALDDSADAIRKRVVRMTYPEFVAMIEFRERKAAEMREEARRARMILTQHPHWADNPGLTLAEVLGISE